MFRIPDRKTILRILSLSPLLLCAGAGVFLVIAPYQASRVRADLADWIYARGEDPLVLATASEDGAYYALGNLLRQYLDASRSYQVEVKATRGSVENIALLREGAADLALIQGGLAAERESTTGEWSMFAPDETRLVSLANLGRQYVHIVVPADSDIQRFRDLAGRRVGVGASGGGSEAMAQDIMSFFRFQEEATLVSDHNPDLVEAFLDGEIDAAFTVYGLFAPAMERLLSSGWYRLVPMEEAPAVASYLPGTFAEELKPYLYGPNRSIPEAPLETLGVNTLLVCQSDLPSRQVYTVLEEIFSGPFLKMARLTDLDEEGAQDALHLPLHSAAEAFYKRRDPISSDRFEILSFFLAGIVCVASVVHFLVGRHRISAQAHRREAIRPYFEAMLDYGDAVEAAASPHRLTCLIHKIMATQRGAERKWLEGDFDTEDMENLYAVYSLRCNNAFNKIFDMHLQAIRGVGGPTDDGEGGFNSTWSDDGDDDDQKERWFRNERDEEPDETAAATPSNLYQSRNHDDGRFFSGSPLAGIDQTKKEVAATLPSRYDSGLLYDTEASGAGAVRIRTPRPAAELQASVDRRPAVPAETPRISTEVTRARVARDVPGVQPDEGAPPASPPAPPAASEPDEVLKSPEPDPPDDRPDQMMLF